MYVYMLQKACMQLHTLAALLSLDTIVFHMSVAFFHTLSVFSANPVVYYPC